MTPPDNSRRSFMTRLAATFSAGLILSPSTALAASSTPDESWLKNLKGKHKLFLDVGVAGSVPLLRASNYLDTYIEAYNLKDADLNLFFGAHGQAIPTILNHDMWARYELGRRGNTNDPVTKEPIRKNPFVTANETLGASNIQALQARGVRFLACGRALARFSRMLAPDAKEEPATTLATLRANVLPGVTIVPAMIVAVDRAQEEGISYQVIT
jgi:intracellular sulfur oxidation DsrE/DsrF family protein